MQHTVITTTNSTRRKLVLALSAALLIAGALGLTAMMLNREEIEETAPEQPLLPVSVISVQKADYPVTLQGYGLVKVVNEVVVSADLNGALTYVSPKLEPGEIFEKDELLLRVETCRFESAKKELEAKARRVQEAMAKKLKQHSLDQRRHEIAHRNLELAMGEFQRTRRLFAEHRVTTKSELDKAEATLNAAKEHMLQLEEAIKIHPHILAEFNYEHAEITAELEAVLRDVAKCEIRSPISGRVKEAKVEVGKYVEAGQTLAVLADDTVLEVEVALGGQDIRQWLPFEERTEQMAGGWFSGLRKVDCKMRWVEDPHVYWSGQLHRAVRYDPKTLTLVLAVRIDTAEDAHISGISTPLAEGMFCRVDIPGKTLRNVIRLPRLAVNSDQTVCIARDNHLRTIPVQILWERGNHVYIGKGLNNGDRVIVSRLVNPIEHTKLEIISTNKGAGTCGQHNFFALRP